MGSLAALVVIVSYLSGVFGGSGEPRRSPRAGAFPGLDGWRVEAANSEERAALPSAVVRIAGRDFGVLVDPAGRRYVAAVVPATNIREAQRRLVAMESLVGVVDGQGRYNVVDLTGTSARSGSAATFTGRSADGRLGAFWIAGTPPRAVLAGAAAAPAQGRLIRTALRGGDCRPAAVGSVRPGFEDSPQASIARREASVCTRSRRPITVVAFESKNGADVLPALREQNRSVFFRRGEIPSVHLPCGPVVNADRYGADWIVSFYIIRKRRGREVRPWAFFVLSPERRAALRTACELIDVAPPG
jgi:hypothetical protein